MIILYFESSFPPYSRGDVASWPVANDFVRQALTPVLKLTNGKPAGTITRARVITEAERDRILEEQRSAGEAARDRTRRDAGLDIVYLTEIAGHHVGDVVHLNTADAAEVLAQTGAYYSGGVQIGSGPVARPASEAEKRLDGRARVEALIAELGGADSNTDAGDLELDDTDP